MAPPDWVARVMADEPLRRVHVLPFNADRGKYPSWATRFRAFAADLGLAAVLAEAEEDEEVEVDEDDNAKLFNKLVMSLEGAAAHLVDEVEEGDGRALWLLLAEECAPNTAYYMESLERQLEAITYAGSTHMTGFLDSIQNVLKSARATGADFRPFEVRALRRVYSQVPEKYYAVTAPAQADPDFTFVQLRRQLRDFADSIGDNTPASAPPSTPAPVAFVGVERGGPLRRGRGGNRGRGGRRQGFQGQCYNCGQYGHRQRDCSRASGSPGDGGRRQGPSVAPRSGRSFAGVAGAGDRDAPVGDFLGILIEREADVAVSVAQLEHSSGPLSPPDGSADGWICVDSGASTHVINRAEPFVAPPVCGESTLMMADSTTATPAGSGPATLHLCAASVPSGRVTLHLKRAMYLPRAPFSLLSVSQLCAHGHSVSLCERPRIELAGGLSLPLHQHNNLYWLRCAPSAAVALATEVLPAGPEGAGPGGDAALDPALGDGHPNQDHRSIGPAASSESLPQDPLDKHRVLGHLNAAAMRRMGYLRPDEQLPFCEACVLGKSHRATLPKHAAPRHVPPGMLTHSDVTGLASVRTFGGYGYAVEFIDDYSRFCKVYLMRSKNEVLPCFQRYHALLASSAFPMRPGAVLQSDNGGEYRSAAFAKFSAEHGVVQRYSAPHTQAQNGIAERNWRTLCDSARAMLQDARLPEQYWGLALLHAADVRNHMVSSITGRIPFQDLFPADRDAHLVEHHSFGQTAYVNIERQLRTKWAPKSRRGVYVGRSSSSLAHLVFFPDTNTIVESSHVTFAPFLPAPLGEGVNGRAAGDVHAPNEQAESDGQASVAPGSQGPPPLIEENDAQVTADQPVRPEPFVYEDEPDAVHVPRAEPAVAMTAVGSGADVDEVPRTAREALAGPHAVEWSAAIEEEAGNIMSSDTFEFIEPRDLPSGAVPGQSHFVLTEKRDENGRLLRRKARIVYNGRGQEASNPFLLFAPVVAITTVRLLLALSVVLQLTCAQMDVTAAFLNAPVDEDFFMWLPPQWPRHLLPDGGGGIVGRALVKLKRALYGLRRAPRYWYDTVFAFFERQGFRRSACDACLFTKVVDSTIIIVLLYVDDMLIFCKNTALIDSFKKTISSAFKMKDLGIAKFCLGIELQFSPGSVVLKQSQYIVDTLARFHMSDCRSVGTPLVPNTEQTAAADADEALDSALATRFRAIVGSLMYLATCTRPDIAAAVGQLSRFMSKPTVAHLNAAKHCLRYLRGTTNVGIGYSNSGTTNILTGACDANWASIAAGSRSTTGYYFAINNGPVSWKSRLQSLVALSTAEAEFQALMDATRECLYLRDLLAELGIKQLQPTRIDIDNQPAITIANNHATTPRVKHIALRINFVRQQLALRNIVLNYCPTADNTADIFTKSLPRPAHLKHMADLCVSED